MKTKILRGVFALAVTVATGYGVNQSMQKDTDLSEMALSNVEALAWFEGGDGDGNTIGCPGGTCSMTDSFGRSCTACCPSGLKPKCDLSFGTCSCE